MNLLYSASTSNKVGAVRHSSLSSLVLLAALSAILLVGVFVPLKSAHGGDQSSILAMFRKKQPEGNSDALKLKVEHGPWLILAATLSGEDAEQQATELANEIRRDLRLASYILEKTFDSSGVLGSTTQLVNELDGSTTQYRAWTQYANGNSEKVFAVLVGEFSSTEDPRIKTTLEKIRTADPKTLRTPGADGQRADNPNEDSSNWLVQQYRSVIWSRTNRKTNQQKGPMGAAFVTRNPLLPEEFFQAPKMDDFVMNLNKQVQHSLLECPGDFTVRVASFYGFASTELISAGKSNEGGASNALDRAAEKANKLTLALRERGEDAYQFHDRFGSFVTIGSFDMKELGSEQPNGGFRYNPQILAIIEKYCGYRTVTVKDPGTGAVSNRQSLNSLDKVPFDIDGKPMAVPRRKTSRLYSGSLLGGR